MEEYYKTIALENVEIGFQRFRCVKCFRAYARLHPLGPLPPQPPVFRETCLDTPASHMVFRTIFMPNGITLLKSLKG